MKMIVDHYKKRNPENQKLTISWHRKNLNVD